MRRLIISIILSLGAWCGGTLRPAFAETCRFLETHKVYGIGEGIHGIQVQHPLPGGWWDEDGYHESWCAAPIGTKQATFEVRLLHVPGPGSLTLWPFTYYSDGWKGVPMPTTPQIRWTGPSRKRRYRITVGLGLDWIMPDLMVYVKSDDGPIHMTWDLVQ